MHPPTTSAWDYAIIGAGMAGAALGWELAQAGARVLLLETESQPGMHSTGRSAALFMPTYGTAAIRALTRTSRAFYSAPPADFCDHPLLTPRGVLYIATPEQQALLHALETELRPHSPGLARLDTQQMLEHLPCLQPQAIAAGLYEADASDIDVHALHQGYLRGLRRRAGQVRCNARVMALQHAQGQWRLTLADGTLVQAHTVVNAAGAWADAVATLATATPVGLVPCRRSAFTFAPPPATACAHWPAALGADESYYFKPDAGQLLGSPANADPTHAHDVQPEALDVATGIWHIEQVSTLRIHRPTHTWAGLRSFVEDGNFVIGWDGAAPHFFWLAALGGYGIQSAAGYAQLARQLALGQAPEAPADIVQALAPQRLRVAA